MFRNARIQALCSTSSASARSPDVYVSTACANCAESRRLAAEVVVRFPRVRVHVVDLDQSADNPSLPDGVVAVPTYVLDGQVVSFGNPYPEDLFALLSEYVG